MATIYPRAGSRKLWAAYKDASGTRKLIATPYTSGKEALAQRFADEIERQAKRSITIEKDSHTVRAYAKKWIDARRARGMEHADEDESRLKRFALGTLGAMPLAEVRPRHLRELVLSLKTKVGTDKKQMAPRSVRHVFTLLHTMFADAVVDEMITANPCVLKRDDLPKKVDKDPQWRATAFFSREEVETLISSGLIPEDRRVLNAILFLSGARFGEASALKWSDYDKNRKPLSHLLIAKSYSTKALKEKSTKTQAVREVPVHPTLARVLAQWRLSGWQATYGRAPNADDLIVPSRELKNRNVNHGLKRFHQDLERLGLRRRRQHDARRSFITIARRDGARKDILEAITHGPRGDIVDMYTTLPWELLCEEVAKLKIEQRKGEVIALPIAVNGPTVADDLLQSCYSDSKYLEFKEKNGGVDGTRTRGLRRDRAAL